MKEIASKLKEILESGDGSELIDFMTRHGEEIVSAVIESEKILKIGSRVIHYKFGEGEVIALTGVTVATVNFDEQGDLNVFRGDLTKVR